MKTQKKACLFCGKQISEPDLADRVRQKWILYNTHYQIILELQKGYLEYTKKYKTYSEVKELEKRIELFEKRWKDVNI